MNKHHRADREDGHAPWDPSHGKYSYPGALVWKLAWAAVGMLFFFVMAYGFGQL